MNWLIKHLWRLEELDKELAQVAYEVITWILWRTRGLQEADVEEIVAEVVARLVGQSRSSAREFKKFAGGVARHVIADFFRRRYVGAGRLSFLDESALESVADDDAFAVSTTAQLEELNRQVELLAPEGSIMRRMWDAQNEAVRRGDGPLNVRDLGKAVGLGKSQACKIWNELLEKLR